MVCVHANKQEGATSPTASLMSIGSGIGKAFSGWGSRPTSPTPPSPVLSPSASGVTPHSSSSNSKGVTAQSSSSHSRSQSSDKPLDQPALVMSVTNVGGSIDSDRIGTYQSGNIGTYTSGSIGTYPSGSLTPGGSSGGKEVGGWV